MNTAVVERVAQAQSVTPMVLLQQAVAQGVEFGEPADVGGQFGVLTGLWRDGVDLDDGPVKADEFVPLQVYDGESLVRITLHEGRNRIVRRLMDELGFPVTRLVRTDVGPIALGEQRPGSIRVLGRDEIGALYKAVGL